MNVSALPYPSFRHALLHDVEMAVAPPCLDALAQAVELVSFADGDVVIREGEVGDHALLIAQGEIEVFRDGSGDVLARLGAGMLLGELALTSGQPRAASARAVGAARAWRIDRGLFERYLLNNPELDSLFAKKVYAQLSRSHAALRAQYGALEEADGRYRALAFLFVAMMLMLSGYALLNALVLDGLGVASGSPVRFWFSRVMEGCALVVLVTLARRCGLDRAAMGVSGRGLARALGEGVVLSLPLMAVMALLRVRLWPPEAEAPLVDWVLLDWTYLSYAVVAPVQEWIARGVFQTAIERLLPGRHRGMAAVVIASLVFSMLHLHLNPALAVVSLISGLIWGAMFVRHRSLAGVSVSHFLLGNWAGLIGLWGLWA